MIKYLKQYTDKTYEELVNSLIWFDNPLKLKAIFAKLSAVFLTDAPIDGKLYGRKNEEWSEVLSTGGGVASYKVFTGILIIDGGNGTELLVKEDTITGMTVAKISSNIFDISFSNPSDVLNAWVAPMVFQSKNTLLAGVPGSFGFTDYFIPLFSVFNTNYGGLGGEVNVLRIILPSDYIYPDTFGQGAVANIEIRVYN